MYFFFKDTATTEIYTLSLHDALPISRVPCQDSSFAQGEPARKTAGVTALLRPRSLALAALVFLAAAAVAAVLAFARSEEHTPELQSRQYIVCRLLFEKKNFQSRVHVN